MPVVRLHVIIGAYGAGSLITLWLGAKESEGRSNLELTVPFEGVNEAPPPFFIGDGSLGGGPGLTAQRVHQHCLPNPVASSHLEALEGWRRAQCAELRRCHLIQLLILWWPLEDALNDDLQLEHDARLLGVCKDGGLVALDHEKHVYPDGCF